MEILTKSLSDGGMRLPPDIAQAAFEKRIAKGQPGFEEGIGWFETFWGKEKKWREGVLQSKDKLKKELDILERSIDDMKAQIKEAKANGEKFPVDLEMRLDKLEADADKLDKQLGEYHKMYRDLKEERDAYRIGDAANAEYSRLVREQELIRKEMAAEPGPITKRPAALGPVAPPGAPVETK
jgi:ASC-1-like (ASCH) protein